jgi:hypothetical protein
MEGYMVPACIERCDKHDRHWDSDMVEQCPLCAQAERAAAQEPRCTYPDCSCDGPGDDGGCGMTAPAQAEPQPKEGDGK